MGQKPTETLTDAPTTGELVSQVAAGSSSYVRLEEFHRFHVIIHTDL